MKSKNVFFVVVALILNAVIVGFSLVLIFQKTLVPTEETSKILGLEWNLGWIIAFVLTLYNIFSLKVAKATGTMAKYGTVWGVIEVFGRPVYAKGPGGLFYVPLGIAHLIVLPYTTIEDQYPDDPEKIWKGDQDKTPVGMVPPIRLTSSGSEETTKDPLERRLTLEISFVNRFKIIDPIVFRKTIGTLEEFRRQVRDIVVRTGGQQIAKRSPKDVLEKWEEIDTELNGIVEKTAKDWGVITQNVYMGDIDPSKRVNTAMAEATEALYLRKKKETDAEAQKFVDERKGMGEGAAEKAILDGRTAGLAEMKDKLGLEPGLVLSAETARAITNNPGQKTVITGVKGFADLIGIATGISKTLKDEKNGGLK